MKILFSTLALLASLTGAAVAGPLNPADLPQDAKWVIHIDYEALTKTVFADHFREERPEQVKHIRQWMEKNLGIDPRQDLKGLTLFSDTYDPHSGAAVLTADYSREKVKSLIESKDDVKSRKWRDFTLYEWTMKPHGKSSQQKSSHHGSDDAHSTQSAGYGSQKQKQVTAVLVDRKTLVLAPSEQRAKSVVKLLEGEAPSLKGEDSKLVAEAPQGAAVYGAAIDLQKISQREGVFPILQQHKYIMWSLGEADGKVFEKVRLVADSEQTAEKMKTALEGFVALAQVWAADAQDLAGLYKDVEIRQDGSTVRVDWTGDPQDVVAAMDEVHQRFEKWRQARGKRTIK